MIVEDFFHYYFNNESLETFDPTPFNNHLLNCFENKHFPIELYICNDLIGGKFSVVKKFIIAEFKASNLRQYESFDESVLFHHENIYPFLKYYFKNVLEDETNKNNVLDQIIPDRIYSVHMCFHSIEKNDTVSCRTLWKTTNREKLFEREWYEL